MKTLSLLAAALALTCAGPAWAQSGDSARNAAIDTFPQVRASPGIYKSGNDCAPDRAEPAWGADNRLLGYVCVRNPTR
jgi:hypothetical protein